MTQKTYKLAVFDMDGVLTQPVSSWEYVHNKLGVNNSENLRLYRNDELAYIDFLKKDVLLWLDKNGPIKADIVKNILYQIPLRDRIRETVSELSARNIRSVIISGGIYWLAEKIGDIGSFAEIYANKIKTDSRGYIIPDGEVMVDPKRKDLIVQELQNRLGVEKEDTISIGDTLQDARMFYHSGLSIAFNPVDDTLAGKASVTLRGNDVSAILDVIGQE